MASGTPGHEGTRWRPTRPASRAVEARPVVARGVWTTFADLLANGVAFARALSLARGEILAGRDSVVVRDGTHRLRPPRGEPGVFRLERGPDGFAVTYDATAPDAAGHRFRSPFASDGRVVGVARGATLEPAALRTLFERHTAPVRFEGGPTTCSVSSRSCEPAAGDRSNPRLGARHTYIFGSGFRVKGR
ncbi:hypothetical protein BRC85_03670 [Halobacteriales archaeon QS_1_69_70]|nr:MAG: hypothetical protein BRC85_03670 [Halobacteriales archaeon QS_1_69_70]